MSDTTTNNDEQYSTYRYGSPTGEYTPTETFTLSRSSSSGSEQFDNSPVLNPDTTAQTNFEQEKKRRKIKRRQVSKACTNCQRLHAKCDEERPCRRCIKTGAEGTCVDLPRKKREVFLDFLPRNPMRKFTLPECAIPMMAPSTGASASSNSPFNTTTKSNEDQGSTPINNNSEPPTLTISPFATTPYSFSAENLQKTTYSPQVYDRIPNIQHQINHKLSPFSIDTPNYTERTPIMYHNRAFDYDAFHDRNAKTNGNNNNRDYPQYQNQDLNLLTQENPFQKYSTTTTTPINSSPWQRFVSGPIAISIWKDADLQVLVEANQTFIDMLGYPYEHLKTRLTGQSLFVKIEDEGSWPRRCQIATLYGIKHAFLIMQPLFNELTIEKYIFVSLLENSRT